MPRKIAFRKFLKADLLRHYCDACDARGDRFDQIGQRLPNYIWFLLGAFSIIWLWFFWARVSSGLLEFEKVHFGIYHVIDKFTFLYGTIVERSNETFMENFVYFFQNYIIGNRCIKMG